MPSDYDPHEDFTRISLEFLFSDLALASTFLDLMASRKDQRSALRARCSARRAYDVVSEKRSLLAISDADKAALDSQLACLRQRLCEAGERFE